jgi:hypothetical protein
MKQISKEPFSIASVKISQASDSENDRTSLDDNRRSMRLLEVRPISGEIIQTLGSRRLLQRIVISFMLSRSYWQMKFFPIGLDHDFRTPPTPGTTAMRHCDHARVDWMPG